MPEDKYASIRLKNQLCFPLYACSKEIVRRYKPHLDELDLTYTQYIAMMVLWEKKQLTVKELGKELYLDSGTLTPLLKKLEVKGYVKRERMESDERNLRVTIAESGEDLQERALTIPEKMHGCVKLDEKDARALFALLNKILETFEIEE